MEINDFFDKMRNYESKKTEVENKTASAVGETEEFTAEELDAMEKFASLPLSEALEVIKPVVKTASFLENV